MSTVRRVVWTVVLSAIPFIILGIATYFTAQDKAAQNHIAEFLVYLILPISVSWGLITVIWWRKQHALIALLLLTLPILMFMTAEVAISSFGSPKTASDHTAEILRALIIPFIVSFCAAGVTLYKKAKTD